MTQKKLILVAGPTAVGKTEFCIQLAREFDAEIFSCDSRQFYRELSIGTAKPTEEELSHVPHHFINNLSVQDDYSVADYEKEINEGLHAYFKRKSVGILTGGSGLFMKAVTHGLDNIPDVPTEVRSGLLVRMEKEGLPSLVAELTKLDPNYAAHADMNNKQRVVRALEVSLFTGKPFSAWHNGSDKKREFDLIKIGLDRPREELYQRINLRVEQMLEQGLIDEVKSVQEYEQKNALQTVGYKEVFSFLNGEINFNEMKELIQRNTRRYAKRQLTWFRNQDVFQWFHPEDIKSAIFYIRNA